MVCDDDGVVEIAVYELKGFYQKDLVMKQESKSIRINQCLNSVNEYIGNDQYSLKCMNWYGYEGHLYDLVQFNGVTVAMNRKYLMHPINYNDFNKDIFKDSILALIDNSRFIQDYQQNISSRDIPNIILSLYLEPPRK
jgi:hypothetical protein